MIAGRKLVVDTSPALYDGPDEAVFDKYGRQIRAGYVVLCPRGSGGKGNGAYIRIGRVEDFGRMKHRGYGYFTRHIVCKDVETGEIFTHRIPANCMLVEVIT